MTGLVASKAQFVGFCAVECAGLRHDVTLQGPAVLAHLHVSGKRLSKKHPRRFNIRGHKLRSAGPRFNAMGTHAKYEDDATGFTEVDILRSSKILSMKPRL